LDWKKEIKRDIPKLLDIDFANEIIDWLILVNEFLRLGISRKIAELAPLLCNFEARP